MAGRGDLPPSGFGPMLRREREGKGLTQKQLAEASGIHPNTVAKLERGDQEPAWPAVLALAGALGVPCTAFSAEVVPSRAVNHAGPAEAPPRRPPPTPEEAALEAESWAGAFGAAGGRPVSKRK